MNLKLSSSRIELLRGEIKRLIATAEGEDKFPEVAWSSSDESVVKVDVYGGLHIAGEGAAVVSAKHEESGAEASCDVVHRYYPYMDDALTRKYNLQVIKAATPKNSTPAPEYITKFLETNHRMFFDVIEREWKITGQWMYIRAEADMPHKMQTSAGATNIVLSILTTFIGIKELPGYSEENLQSAVRFWQATQNIQTGLFFPPENGYAPAKKMTADVLGNRPANQFEYVELLERMGAKPLYAVLEGKQFGRALGIQKAPELEKVWDVVLPHFKKDLEAAHGASATGACLSKMACMYEHGQKDIVHWLEGYGSNMLSYIRPETGTTKLGLFKNYGGSENTLKMLGRVIGYWGVCNLPYVRKLADSMIKHQVEIKEGAVPGNIRNMIELTYHPLTYHNYRRDELIEAIAYMSGSLEEYLATQAEFCGYCLFTIRECATALNWDGFRDDTYLTEGPKWGIPFGFRLFVGPFGRWLNLEEKEPYEIGGHPDYEYEKYGMEAVTEEMRRRKIYPKCEERGWLLYDTSSPVFTDEVYWTGGEVDEDFLKSESSEGMELGVPDYTGPKVTMKFDLDLKDVGNYKNPFFRIRFKGTFDLYLNGVLMKSIPTQMFKQEWQWCGMNIKKDQRHVLREGENLIAIKFTTQYPDSYISVGVIDWY